MRTTHFTVASIAGALLATAFLLAGAAPASANPAFAQAAGGAVCSTCHMPGQETAAPRSGFTAQGQAIYYSFQTPGSDCYQNINRAVSSVLAGGAAACVPAAQPYAQPQPQPQPQPYNYTYPQTYPQPQTYPAPQPYQPPQTYPQPYGPPQPYAPPPQYNAGKLFKFFDGCFFSKNYFIVRLGGNPNDEVRFMLKNGHSMRMHIPPGTTWAGACGQWPNEGSSFSSAD